MDVFLRKYFLFIGHLLLLLWASAFHHFQRNTKTKTTTGEMRNQRQEVSLSEIKPYSHFTHAYYIKVCKVCLCMLS